MKCSICKKKMVEIRGGYPLCKEHAKWNDIKLGEILVLPYLGKTNGERIKNA